ncbi:Ger(x)C family spore germination protein [Virgibacillus flavescens]|uniref:Ger(x)C family spore germination protein n=1 Tax=Virgibacillus flavescens TaxID=1611422 RepID=UPI003D33AC22
MKRIKTLLILVTILTFLTGCWDQVLFKDERLIMGVAFDKIENDKILTTATIPIVEPGQAGVSSGGIQIVSGVGKTPRQSRMQIDRKIARSFNAAKMLTVVLGGELIKENIFPLLDVYYRDPRSNLSANLIVTEEEASEILKLKLPNQPRVSEYITDLMHSSKVSTIIPESTIEMIGSALLDSGQDFGLPLVTIDNTGTNLMVKGFALFNGDKYTGEYLTPQQTTLYLLMAGKKGRTARLSIKVFDDKSPDYLNYITVDVEKVKRKIKTKYKVNKPVVNIDMKLKVTVIEYPHDKLNSSKELAKLNKAMSENLTKKSKLVIKKIQEANSDLFGIGRQIIAYHPKHWDKKEWKKLYQTIDINSNVKVEIVQHGIVN